MTETSKVPVLRLILVPAILTLAVTVLRLVGELQRWSPSLFNRDPGGGGALVGIVWLIPIFGMYFALKLAAAGEGPASIGKAAGFAFLALAVNMGLGFASFAVIKSVVGQLGFFTVTSWLTLFIARPGWPALWRVLLAYGIAARIPVLVIMYLAIFGGWDSHYAKARPDFPAMGPWGLFFWTALLPQISIWIQLTIVGGILFGALALAIRRLMSRPAAVPVKA